MVKFDNIFYVGDTVETKYGLNKIKKIELMPEPRHYSKCGINVEKMFTNMKNYCVAKQCSVNNSFYMLLESALTNSQKHCACILMFY